MKRFLGLIFLLLLSGCATYQRCSEKFGHQTDTLLVTVHDTLRIAQPGDTSALGFSSQNLASLALGQRLWLQPKNSTRPGRVRAFIERTGADSFRAQASVPDTVYQVIPQPVKVPCPVSVFRPKPLEVPYVPFYYWAALGGLATACLYFSLRRV